MPRRIKEVIYSLVLLTSLFVGVKSVLIGFTSQSYRQVIEPHRSKGVEFSTDLNKTIHENKKKLGQITSRFEVLGKQVESLGAIPKEAKFSSALSKATESLKNFENRLNALETSILDSPEKAISIPLLRKEIAGIQASSKSEFTALRNEVTRMYDQNKWFIGLMFTMALGMIGLAGSNFIRPSKKEDQD